MSHKKATTTAAVKCLNLMLIAGRSSSSCLGNLRRAQKKVKASPKESMACGADAAAGAALSLKASAVSGSLNRRKNESMFGHASTS